METVISAQGLCLRTGKRYILNNIDWSVKKDEHWLVFGLNGSGKTTLLSIIAGMCPPTSGTLTVLGQTYNRQDIFALRQRVGWVSSSFYERYYHGESALHVVLAGLFGTMGIAYGITDGDVRRAKVLLRELQLGDKLHQPFDLMSKGERQNVLMARALLSKPDILLLDEPGAGLDIYAREQMMDMVRQLAESGQVTIIYVTHQPEEIQPFMAKTMLLRNGRVFAKGETNQVITGAGLSALLNGSVEVSKNDGRVQMSIKVQSDIGRLGYGEQVKHDG